MAERIFTDEELKETGRRTVDLVVEAVDSGQPARAKGLARRMYKEFQAMHDLYLNWVTGLLTFIAQRYGEEAVYQALHQSCAAWLKPLPDLYAREGPRRQAEMLAAGLRGHLQPMTIQEDEEKFTLMMEPCGSGGRLMLQGAYDRSGGFARLGKPQPMTYGRRYFPIYCAHCAFQEILPTEWKGHPLFITEPAQKLGEEPCRVYLYKDPRAIPAAFYRRVGKEKPQA